MSFSHSNNSDKPIDQPIANNPTSQPRQLVMPIANIQTKRKRQAKKKSNPNALYVPLRTIHEKIYNTEIKLPDVAAEFDVSRDAFAKFLQRNYKTSFRELQLTSIEAAEKNKEKFPYYNEIHPNLKKHVTIKLSLSDIHSTFLKHKSMAKTARDLSVQFSIKIDSTVLKKFLDKEYPFIVKADLFMDIKDLEDKVHKQLGENKYYEKKDLVITSKEKMQDQEKAQDDIEKQRLEQPETSNNSKEPPIEQQTQNPIVIIRDHKIAKKQRTPKLPHPRTHLIIKIQELHALMFGKGSMKIAARSLRVAEPDLKYQLQLLKINSEDMLRLSTKTAEVRLAQVWDRIIAIKRILSPKLPPQTTTLFANANNTSSEVVRKPKSRQKKKQNKPHATVTVVNYNEDSIPSADVVVTEQFPYSQTTYQPHFINQNDSEVYETSDSIPLSQQQTLEPSSTTDEKFLTIKVRKLHDLMYGKAGTLEDIARELALSHGGLKNALESLEISPRDMVTLNARTLEGLHGKVFDQEITIRRRPRADSAINNLELNVYPQLNSNTTANISAEEVTATLSSLQEFEQLDDAQIPFTNNNPYELTNVDNEENNLIDENNVSAYLNTTFFTEDSNPSYLDSLIGEDFPEYSVLDYYALTLNNTEDFFNFDPTELNLNTTTSTNTSTEMRPQEMSLEETSAPLASFVLPSEGYSELNEPNQSEDFNSTTLHYMKLFGPEEIQNSNENFVDLTLEFDDNKAGPKK